MTAINLTLPMFQETPLDKCGGHSGARLQDRAVQSGQKMSKLSFFDILFLRGFISVDYQLSADKK